MNIFVCLRIYMKYGDLSAEIPKLYVGASSFLSFEVVGIGCACSWWKLVLSPHFNAASSDVSWVWDVQSCWVSPAPPFVLSDLFLQNTVKLVSTQNCLIFTNSMEKWAQSTKQSFENN